MKILKILILGLFLSLNLNAKIVATTSTKSSIGEGTGLSREEAINNAIVEAVGKMSGVSINSLKTSQTQVLSDDKGTNIQDTYSEQISKATKGRADTFEVNYAQQDANGKWLAKVTIFKTSTTKSYKAPGLSADSRRSITIFSTSTQYANIGAVLQQKIIANLLKSRKFNVLDRDSSGYYEMEKALIKSGDSANDEIYKLKNVLATDYILLFNVSGVEAKSKTSNLTGKTRAEAEVVVDYRVLLFATRQIKFSNTLTMKVNLKDGSLGASEKASEQIATRITSDILNAIYPLKVSVVENDEVVFSQTLNQNDIYECFSLGKVVKDAYTKENTGRVESKVAQVQVTRVTPKLSYAKILEGKVGVGDICRPLNSDESGVSAGRDANYKIDENGGVNLGF